ncbi:MAG: Bro-N domain-containing protein [Candidatus Diapherotrites archaeon]|nr:Bro-N domain-containing protein [Candidatus Diapherotrites archaeon]
MEAEKALAVFEGKKIRKTWFNEEWWFVAQDIIVALTNSTDPKGYLKDMRRRDEVFAKGWVQIATPLPIKTSGGNQQMSCVSTKGALRLVQSVPSKKAEPFKLWLAKVGYERIQEIQTPELAQERMKLLYDKKGYSKQWIDKRLRGIAIRQDLTDEWKQRGAEREKDFAILTAEISKATFDMTPNQYKKHKSLTTQNLRDHMDDIELVLTMLGEATTTRITQTRDSQEFPELNEDSIDGGTIAGTTRKNIEQKIGKSVIRKENYLKTPEKIKRLESK